MLEKIYKSGVKFLESQSIEETYATIIREATQLVHAQDGTIILEQDGHLQRVYATIPQFYLFNPRSNGFIRQTIDRNKPQIRPFTDVTRVHPEVASLRFHSDIMIPLSYKDKTIGVMTVWSKKKQKLTRKELLALKVFGQLATLAIINNQLNDETKKALQTHDLFISMASHEMKTPLTSIYAFLQLMQTKLRANEPIQQIWVDTMASEVERLSKLVNELLQTQKIATGQLDYQWKVCDLVDITRRAVRGLKVSYKRHHVAYHNTIPGKKAMIEADYDKLLQVINSIVSNAVKFSPRGSTVTMQLKRQDDFFELAVSDEGSGIEKRDLPNIFNTFYRGQNGSHEGMGIGLYLTKQIIDKHKGRITIDSARGKGTEVRILLPALENGN